MRKFLLSFLLVAATTVTAAPVTVTQAQQRASQFLQQRLGVTLKRLNRTQAPMVQQATGGDAYYVFNIGSNDGFVIVSGDDRTEPILGYADSGTFDVQNLPDNLRAFLQEYEDAILRLRLLNIPVGNSNSSRAPERQSLLMTTPTYNQNAPYSQECPQLVYGGRKSHAVTGCVATAMAELMAYHKHPAQTTAEIPAYTFTFQNQPYTMRAIPAGTVINWDNILPDYAEENTNTDQENEVAFLMKYCGTSVRMNYGVNDSGGSTTPTNLAADAFVNYFDYEETTVRFLLRKEYNSRDWTELLYQELKAGRPVLYNGQSSTGGHAFLLDGYSAEDDMFHVNWGWGGLSNGFFRLSVLNPQSQGVGSNDNTTGYGMMQGAVVGIMPNDGISTPKPPVMTLRYLYPTERKYTREDFGLDFPAMYVAYKANNFTGSTASFDLGLRIIDSEGQTVADIPDANVENRPFVNGAFWETGTDHAVPVTITGNLPDGDYRLIATSRLSGSGEMQPDQYADSRYIGFTIYNTTLSITETCEQPQFGLSIDGDIGILPVYAGMTMAGKPHYATVHIRNDGTTYRGDLYFTINEANPDDNVNKAVILGAFIDLPEEGDGTYMFRFVPNQQGVNTLRLYAYDDTDQWRLLGTTTVTVTGAPDVKLSLANVSGFNSELDAIVGDEFKVTVRLTNEGVVPFDGKYEVYLSYSGDEGVTWVDRNWVYPSFFTAHYPWSTYIDPGQSVEREFTWTGLRYDYYHRLFLENYADNSEFMRSEYFRLVDPILVKGDVNGDGEVGIGDIISITNFMAGVPNGVTLEKADVNGDGVVGVGDIIFVTNIMANAW